MPPKRARAAKKGGKAEKAATSSGDEGGSAVSKRSRLAPAAGAGDEPGEALRGALECPVCYETMLPPILQCSSGHPVCTACRAKLKKCPTCRRKLGNIRNLLLEKLAADQRVQFACTFAARGCQEHVQYGDLSAHQEVCRFRPLICPHATAGGSHADACSWTGSEGEIAEHLVANHGAKFEALLPCESAGFCESAGCNAGKTTEEWHASQARWHASQARVLAEHAGAGRRDGVPYCMETSIKGNKRTNTHTR